MYLKISDRYLHRLPKEGRLGVLKWAEGRDRAVGSSWKGDLGGLPTSLVVLYIMCPAFVPSTSQVVVGFGPFLTNCTCM